MFENANLEALGKFFLAFSQKEQYKKDKPKNPFVFLVEEGVPIANAIEKALNTQLNERILDFLDSTMNSGRGERVVARFLCRLDLRNQDCPWDDLCAYLDCAVSEEYKDRPPGRSDRPFTSRPSDLFRSS